MTALIEHPTRVRVAVARLLVDLCGVIPHRVRLSTPNGDGAVVELLISGLFGPDETLSAFLVHDPTPREPHAFNLLVFVDADCSFVVGRVGLLIRPGFRDPTATDCDPFHRQLVTIPPAPYDAEPVRQKFHTLYRTLAAYCSSQLDRHDTDDSNRLPLLQDSLVRLYQCRSLLNPACQTMPYGARAHSPAAFRPVAQLADPRLAGWRSLAPPGLNALLIALLPTVGQPERLADETEFYTAVGWLGPPLTGDHPSRVEGSWLFSPPPEPIVAPEAEQRRPFEIDFEALRVSDGELSRSLPDFSQYRDDFRDIPMRSIGIPFPPIPAATPAPTSQKAQIRVEDVPEDLFDTVTAILTRALAGQAAALPDVEFLVVSEAGRRTKLEPTAPPPLESPADARAGRGLLLD